MKDKFDFINASYLGAGGHGYGSLPKVVKPFWTASGHNNLGDLNINGHVVSNGDDSNCSVWCSAGALDTYCCQHQRPK